MKSPIIGITLDNEDSPSYSKYPWYAARRNYSDSVAQAGGTAVFLPHNTKMIDDGSYVFTNGWLAFTGEKLRGNDKALPH